MWPEAGLSRAVIARDFRDMSAAAARAPLHAFARALSAAQTGDSAGLMLVAQEAAPLIGLGPGLTPSGDDVIAGALIALFALGREEAALSLWHALAPLASTRTSALSLAHLQAAAGGQGHEALHVAINAMLDDAAGALASAIADLARYGHSSGFDGFAGAMLAVETWIATDGGRASEPRLP